MYHVLRSFDVKMGKTRQEWAARRRGRKEEVKGRDFVDFLGGPWHGLLTAKVSRIKDRKESRKDAKKERKKEKELTTKGTKSTKEENKY